MKSRTAVLFATAALALGAATTAQASTTYTLGAVTPGIPLSFGASDTPGGAFIDTFKFTMPTTSSSGYSVVNFSQIAGYNTLFSSIALFKNPDGIVGNSDDVFLSSNNSSGSSLSLAYGATTAGNYYLTVSGVANGTLGGIYTGAISIPVPEPESYAMMLAGLGTIGFLALRRRSSKR